MTDAVDRSLPTEAPRFADVERAAFFVRDYIVLTK